MSVYYEVRTIARGSKHTIECVGYDLAKEQYDDFIERYGSDVEVFLMKVETIKTNITDDI